MIGKTKSGKSTMISSLVFGADKLQEKRDKKTKKRVIDQVEEIKKNGQFKIGHSLQSETFKPECFYDEIT